MRLGMISMINTVGRRARTEDRFQRAFEVGKERMVVAKLELVPNKGAGCGARN